MSRALAHWAHVKTTLVTLAVILVSACAHGPLTENVHTVVPATVYRSAQLSPERLEQLIAQRQLKSVLNLRGASPGEAWYDQEVAVARKANILHLDLALDSRKELTPDQLGTLVAMMKHAPKPLLIHCWAGADRTGLAAALYLFELQKRDPKLAAQALSLKYFHLWMFEAGAMDRTFASYVAAAGARGVPAASAEEPAHQPRAPRAPQ